MMPRCLPFAAALLASAVLVSTAAADEIDDLAKPSAAPSLSFSFAEAVASFVQPPQPGGPLKPAPAPDHPPAYGKAGSRWWTVGTAYAYNFEQASDFNVHLAFSQFLADDLEFAVEAAAWYFDQPGDNTGGVSGSMIFRWHFAHAADYDWTAFVDAGIGILGAFDVVPDGGTSFDFLPRLGAGFTKALAPSIDGESRGSRLMVGLRWHHISNGRIASDTRNPSRDSLLVYVAVVFPF